MNQQEATNIVLVLNRAGLVNAMEGQAAVWAMALEDVSYITAQEVARSMVTNRTSDQRWVTPGDVRAEVKRIRKIRADAMGGFIPPAELDERPRDAIEWQRAYTEAWCDGDDEERAMKRACAALRIDVPLQLEPIPRPEAVKRLMASQGPQCECTPPCMEAHVRPEEGAA